MRLLGEVALGNYIAYVDCGGVGFDLILIGAARAVVIKVAAEPAFAFEGLAVATSFPDLGRAEVAAIRVRVADVLHDGEFALAVELVQWLASGVEGEVVVELEQAVFQAKGGAQIVVAVVGEGDDGVEPVVTSGQLYDDEDAAVALRCGGLRHRAAGEKGGGGAAEGEEAEAAGATDEFAAG